jgi:hypothetical protein
MILDKFRINALKNKIRNRPFIGVKDNSGIYVYKKGKFIVEYRVLDQGAQATKSPLVKIISIKHKLTDPELKIIRAKVFFRKAFQFQTLAYLLSPRIIMSFIFGCLILYFAVIEPYEKKVDRFKLIVAQAMGIDPKQVEYKGGLFSIFGRRQVAYKEDLEYISFNFSPFNLFSSKSTGYVTRWSKERGYTTNPISFDSGYNVWINLSGSWEHGLISNDEVKWDNPQGIANWRISGHKISKKDQDLYIIDKK